MGDKTVVRMQDFSQHQASNNCHSDTGKVKSEDDLPEERKSRILTILLVVLAILLLILLVGLVFREVTRPKDDVCTSAECAEAAARILGNIDQAVDPCDNFYGFSCGEWMRKRTFPETKSTIGTFDEQIDSINVILKNYMENSVDTSHIPTFNKTQLLYQSCMNQEKYQNGARPLLGQYYNLLPVPYISSNWAPSSLEEYTGKLASYKFNTPVIRIAVDVDDRNTSRYMIHFDQPNVLLQSIEYYKNDKYKNVIDAYKNALKEYLRLLYKDFQVTKSESEIEQLINRLLDLETYVAKNTLPLGMRRNGTALYHLKTVGYLQQAAPSLDWIRLIKSYVDESGLPVDENFEIVLQAPDYLSHLSHITKTFTLDDFGVYNTVAILWSNLNHLPSKYRDVQRKLNIAISGSPGEDVRWKKCVSYIEDRWSLALGRAFVQTYFDIESKKEAMDMVANVRQAFSNLLEKNTWMDKNTQKLALGKAYAIKANIGYPDYIMSDTRLEKEASKVVITDDFATNDYNLRVKMKKDSLAHLTEPVNKSEWLLSSVVLNAFYLPVFNQIYFPAAIMQPPFFHKNYPKYLNYGGIGMVIGHEITHGFDDQGRQRDKDGNLRQWWSGSVVSNFVKRAQCIVDQYSNYTAPLDPPINLNGVQTQGENIADNGGIKQAFEAYYIWKQKKNQKEKKLPGLKYTPEQLFFINFAQVWCQKLRDKAWGQKILSGVHCPGMYRVIGPLSNSQEFSDAFRCPRNSPMNRNAKCSVW